MVAYERWSQLEVRLYYHESLGWGGEIVRTSGKILATPLFIIPTKISKERINQISREERESNVKRAARDVALTSFNFRCKYCNLAFMNCLLTLLLFLFCFPFFAV